MTPSCLRGVAALFFCFVATAAAAGRVSGDGFRLQSGAEAFTEATRAAGGNEAGQLEWIRFSAEAYDRARRSGAPFVIEFTADWCAPCKEMKRRTFTDASVHKAADGITLISVDMTDPDDFTARVLRSFEIVAAPTTIFYGPDGKEWKRRGGFIGPEEYARLLRQSRQGEKRDAPKPPAERT